MTSRSNDESGDSLVEVLITLVIVGLIIGGFFTAITTTARASTAHRDLVTADAVLRDYAESTKLAVRAQCPGNAGAPFTVSYSPPAGSGITVTATGLTCPSLTGANDISTVVITATLPNSAHTTRLLRINVRTP